MKRLKYIGTHQRKGMIVEVEDSNVKRLLVSGNWEDLELPKIIIKPIIEEVSNVTRN